MAALAQSGTPESCPRNVRCNQDTAHVGTEGVHPIEDAPGKPAPTHGDRKGTSHCFAEAPVPVMVRGVYIHLRHQIPYYGSAMQEHLYNRVDNQLVHRKMAHRVSMGSELACCIDN